MEIILKIVQFLFGIASLYIISKWLIFSGGPDEFNRHMINYLTIEEFDIHSYFEVCKDENTFGYLHDGKKWHIYTEKTTSLHKSEKIKFNYQKSTQIKIMKKMYYLVEYSVEYLNN